MSIYKEDIERLAAEHDVILPSDFVTCTVKGCGYGEDAGRHLTLRRCEKELGRRCDNPGEHHRFRPIEVTPRQAFIYALLDLIGEETRMAYDDGWAAAEGEGT